MTTDTEVVRKILRHVRLPDDLPQPVPARVPEWLPGFQPGCGAAPDPTTWPDLESLASDEVREGFAAFLEKRQPRWRK